MISLFYLDYSYNNFSSIIPLSICESQYLIVLDLSYNSLSGAIPKCLTSMNEYLKILRLRGNNLSGGISDAFSRNCELKTLHLNGNKLEGQIPRSIVHCKKLEVLDLGNNQINDTFPHFLHNIPSLRVLVLRSNRFQGQIDCLRNNSSWPLLQIMDLAHNSFSGRLHGSCLMTLEAMRDDRYELKHIIRYEIQGVIVTPNYQEEISVIVKGVELELKKILNLFVSIDLSCNRFEGWIPEEIGELKAIYLLNLSHNFLTGSIPSSLGNLRQLESLDLSSNKLSSRIPQQLTKLNFLSVLNLSYNQLVGSIPTGNQFQTFPEASFEGNKGLCGAPLKERCTSDHGQQQPEDKRLHSARSLQIDWNFLSAELGFIFGFGIVIAPLMLFKGWRIRYYKGIDDALFWLFPRLYLRFYRNHGRKVHRTQKKRGIQRQ